MPKDIIIMCTNMNSLFGRTRHDMEQSVFFSTNNIHRNNGLVSEQKKQVHPSCNRLTRRQVYRILLCELSAGVVYV